MTQEPTSSGSSAHLWSFPMDNPIKTDDQTILSTHHYHLITSTHHHRHNRRRLNHKSCPSRPIHHRWMELMLILTIITTHYISSSHGSSSSSSLPMFFHSFSPSLSPSSPSPSSSPSSSLSSFSSFTSSSKESHVHSTLPTSSSSSSTSSSSSFLSHGSTSTISPSIFLMSVSSAMNATPTLSAATELIDIKERTRLLSHRLQKFLECRRSGTHYMDTFEVLNLDDAPTNLSSLSLTPLSSSSDDSFNLEPDSVSKSPADPVVVSIESLCSTDFDGLTCWEPVEAGTISMAPCPDFIEGSNGDHYVYRECLSNGSWSITTNYSGCGFDPNLFMSNEDNESLQVLITEVDKLDASPFEDVRTTMAFEECIDRILLKDHPTGDKGFCPRTFDGWGCWDDTPANTTSFIPCPSFISGFLPERVAFKTCEPDGSWFRHPETNRTWSNYTTCVDRDDLLFREKINNLYISGYSISIIALLVSLAIFFSFTTLKCDRITIHKNLFISFIINNTMWVIWYVSVIYRPEVLVSNDIKCQALHVIVHYFLLCNYLWMFCEGLYLHTLLVVAFVSEEKIIKYFYAIGWGIPFIVITIYGLLRGFSEPDRVLCWIEESKYTWILNGPVCLSILLNAFFLINIVRVLVTKLRAVNSPDAHQTRKAVRATLILIPLLGLQYVLTPFRPDTGSPGEKVYEILAAVFTSFQVQTQLKKWWIRSTFYMETNNNNRKVSSYTLTSAMKSTQYYGPGRVSDVEDAASEPLRKPDHHFSPS